MALGLREHTGLPSTQVHFPAPPSGRSQLSVNLGLAEPNAPKPLWAHTNMLTYSHVYYLKLKGNSFDHFQKKKQSSGCDKSSIV